MCLFPKGCLPTIAFFILNTFLLSHTGNAQKQNNQWRFGYGIGINFSTNPPSAIASAALQTQEGSASIADKNTGNLLFYTDGVTIWDANNNPMPNGTGLAGSSSLELSSTTAAVIVPKPLSSNLYYVVTVDEQYSPGGVRYTEVDMNLNNGLGDVVTGRKNIPLYSTISEKLLVVPAADGCGYWLLTHKTVGQNYAAFSITVAGINTIPVISTVGQTQGNGAGHLKVNRQFNKLATGNFQTGDLELFDFDNNSGVVSNATAIKTNLIGGIYGVEFSPQGNLLYISNIERIIQYNLSSRVPATIAASAYWVSQAENSYFPAALQLGPDDKIYVAAGTVDVIDSPDSAGADCNFKRNGIPQLFGGSGYGLPGWIYPLNSKSNNTIKVGDSCLGKNTTFSVAKTEGINQFNWQFDDPNTGSSNTSNLPDPLHQFSAEGSYKVRLIAEYSCFNDTLFRDVTVSTCCTTGITGIKFIDDTCISLTLRLSVTGTTSSPFIFWRFGDPASGAGDTVTILGSSSSPYPTHTFSAPGVYNICAYFKEPGQPVDSVCRTFSIGQCCVATIGTADSCFNNAMQFSLLSTGVLSGATWDFGDNGNSSNTATGLTASHVFSGKGTFTVRATVTTPCGEVTATKTVAIVNCTPPQPCTGTINVEGICGNRPIPFSVSSSNTVNSIRWNFGDPLSGGANESAFLNPTHLFTVSAGYQIEAIVEFNCGIDTLLKSISLEECNNTCNGTINLVDSCLENAIAFTASANGVISGISWNFGDPQSGTANQSPDINPTHTFSAAGRYNLVANITADCGFITAKKTILVNPCANCVVSIANAFSPNGDGRNDAISPLVNCFLQDYEWQIFNRWGQLIFKTKSSTEKWNGTRSGKPVAGGVYYYRLRYKNDSDKLVDKTGSITLVR